MPVSQLAKFIEQSHVTFRISRAVPLAYHLSLVTCHCLLRRLPSATIFQRSSVVSRMFVLLRKSYHYEPFAPPNNKSPFLHPLDTMIWAS